MSTFTVLEPVDKQLVQRSAHPRSDAYRYAAWLSYTGKQYAMMIGHDGSYTVESAGLESIKFVKEEA